MVNWDGLNRRKFPRVNYPCLITIRHNQGEREALLTHTENVGIGGVCVIINKSVSLFTPVEIELDLIDSDNHIKCHGKVVWSVRRKANEKKKPMFYDVGIEFGDLATNDQKRLDEIVKRLVKLGQQTPFPQRAE